MVKRGEKRLVGATRGPIRKNLTFPHNGGKRKSSSVYLETEAWR